MRILAALVLALIPLAAPATPPSIGGCDCGDVRHMRDRFCTARAARAEYERIERYFQSEEKKTGQPRMFSNADKIAINQKCVQEAINRANDKGSKKATAETSENFPTETWVGKDECRVLVTRDDGNACLRQIVQAHEGMHREACLKRNRFIETGGKVVNVDLLGQLGLKFIGDTKMILTSGEFALEEGAAYALEIQLIAAKWKELQKKCSPSDFQVEIQDNDTLGQQMWDAATQDASGNRIYKMYDLSNDPCPSRPVPTPSQCTLK